LKDSSVKIYIQQLSPSSSLEKMEWKRKFIQIELLTRTEELFGLNTCADQHEWQTFPQMKLNLRFSDRISSAFNQNESFKEDESQLSETF